MAVCGCWSVAQRLMCWFLGSSFCVNACRQGWVSWITLFTVVQHTLYVCDVGLLRGTATLHGSAPWQHDIYLDMAIYQACRVMCSAAAPTPPLPYAV
jgi:hypothetical protein